MPMFRDEKYSEMASVAPASVMTQSTESRAAKVTRERLPQRAERSRTYRRADREKMAFLNAASSVLPAVKPSASVAPQAPTKAFEILKPGKPSGEMVSGMVMPSGDTRPPRVYTATPRHPDRASAVSRLEVITVIDSLFCSASTMKVDPMLPSKKTTSPSSISSSAFLAIATESGLQLDSVGMVRSVTESGASDAAP